ncbi:hypothetical protein MLD38_014060 [Melastoma candidum]|uniref:Uncharacterized protein n=2 Tax=Melastoma candidum TaxID=119954 RepID=A0ACB9RF80_9MYRT|nr:hypothetical protein MLD38_014060 [Melastoma candidum]KAI4376279.1 hypothetical protein MLD38_014060 [Melastoma candidum]
MVNYLLKVTAELENLTNLHPQGSCDDPDFYYFFKLKCGHCGEITEKETCLTLSETVQSGKGTFHLVQKCKFCEREGTMTMIPGKGRPLTFEDAESGKYTPLMLFDCRGFEPTDFSFRGSWSVQSLQGTTFVDIDLSDGEFTEYDEKGECPVIAAFEVTK